MNAVDLPNVILNDDAKDTIKRRTPVGNTSSYNLNPKMNAVISELAKLKPTWTFLGVSAIRESHDTGTHSTFNIPVFKVRDGDEMLGAISHDRGARYGDYKIVVNSPRINQERQRGQGYSTDDPKKAVAKAKKMFGPMTAAEKLYKAEKHAADYIETAVYRHKGEVGKARRFVQEASQRYVSGPGFEQFMLYVSTKMDEGERAKVLWAKETDDTLSNEMAALQDIRDKLGSTNSALIIRDAGKYIVRIGDKVALHDDNTLPVELRTGLGLLKLVDKEHFIVGSGCRVSDEVFVVVLDKEGD